MSDDPRVGQYIRVQEMNNVPMTTIVQYTYLVMKLLEERRSRYIVGSTRVQRRRHLWQWVCQPVIRTQRHQPALPYKTSCISYVTQSSSSRPFTTLPCYQNHPTALISTRKTSPIRSFRPLLPTPTMTSLFPIPHKFIHPLHSLPPLIESSLHRPLPQLTLDSLTLARALDA